MASTRPNNTLYQILGVGERAPIEQIYRKFCDLEKTYSALSEKRKNPEVKACFRAETEAFALLLNNRRREAYDRACLMAMICFSRYK